MTKLISFMTICLSLICLNTYAQNQQERKYLSGNWGGARDKIESKGLYINPRVTVFNQNFVAGNGDNKSAFDGKAQLDVMFNGGSIGLSHWTLVTKAEYNFGNPLSSLTGQVMVPQNTAGSYPGFTHGNRFDISSAFLMYNWGAGNSILAGKLNMIDMAAATKYSGGAGLDAFWNIGFTAPINGITPPYVFGTIASIAGKKLNWTFMLYDPISTVGKTGFESPFSDGVVLAVTPGWKVRIGNSVGNHSVCFTYSTQNGNSLYDLGNINPPVDFPASDKNGRFYISYSFSQPLKMIDENRSWGLFGQLTASDGNPTPVDFSLLLGLGGNSFVKNRAQDKWGIAFSNYSLSGIIDDKAGALGMSLRNELCVETFYDFWLNNWFSIGADVQVTNPVVKSSSTAVFLGFRSSVKF